MIRTQVYLTEEQREELEEIAKFEGKRQSELIREAIDRYIDECKRSRREIILEKAAGMWKDRTDLPDFEKMRRESDRYKFDS